MVRNREVRVRVTRNQFERIKMNAEAKGFRTISDYLRFLCLEHHKDIEDKIVENNHILKQIALKI